MKRKNKNFIQINIKYIMLINSKSFKRYGKHNMKI